MDVDEGSSDEWPSDVSEDWPYTDDEPHATINDADPNEPLFDGTLRLQHDNEFRVLKLLPGSPGDPVSCELKVIPHGHCELLREGVHLMPEWCYYEALSYTWGSWERHAFVSVNATSVSRPSTPVPVSRNLLAALHRLRQPKKHRWLWIDQLCINQNSINERNHQVPLMGKIYSLAMRVVVWLGDALEPSQPEGLPDSQWSGDCLRTVIESNVPWWERSWVVQEVAMARNDPFFAFGSVQLPWAQTMQLLETLENEQPGNSRLPSFRATTSAISSFRHTLTEDSISSRPSRGLPWLWAVVLAYTKCADPRDKVYSLLNLIAPAERELIRPDYGKTASAVFAEATWATIQATNSLLVLSLVTRPTINSTLNMAKSPSWACDFSIDRSREHRGSAVDSGFTDWSREFLARQGLQWVTQWPRKRLEVNVSRDDSFIALKGLYFDRPCSACSCILPMSLEEEPEDTAEAKTALHNLVRALERHYNSSYNYKTFPYRSITTRTRGHGQSWGHCNTQRAEARLRRSLDKYLEARRPYSGPHTLTIDETLYNRRPSPRIRSGQSAQSLDGTLDFRSCKSLCQMYRTTQSQDLRLFVTQYGFLGIAPRLYGDGEEVHIILAHGCSYPMILSRVGPDRWRFRGFAFINGIMDGELAVEGLELEEQTFNIE